MRFNLPEPPKGDLSDEPRVGNVYRCKGGGKTVYWVTVGIDDKSIQLIGINREGIITSAASYGAHVFSADRGREIVGFCPAIESLEFDIDWRE